MSYASWRRGLVRVAGQSCLASPSIPEVYPASGYVLATGMVREL